MGRQTLTLPEDGDHTEILRLLADTFPKMEGLCGGWLLHKATGGSGRRKLTVIPPEAEGYSVKALRAMSAGGKATFYISSDELCIVENACKNCQTMKSQSMLAYVERALNVQGLLHQRTIVQVQLLNLQYANQKERAFQTGAFSSGNGKKLHLLPVVYIGEAGIDTGAIRKEFLTDMVSGIENRFFEGAGNQGKNPKYSLTDLDTTSGEVDIHSLSKEDVSDIESGLLISKVEDSADEQSLMLWADEITASFEQLSYILQQD
ncbi:Isoleucine--tRNA ligase [Dissostichus eleginoides]|uniref:Isoleucine--tRNA ligase n=1 Tax=Dissostichus eleginoides TaxID=100907 RepID=A0AAD9C5C6_DISEL|nr:Isoleucine--tRNA ligase [Dissostichus eleginoides]